MIKKTNFVVTFLLLIQLIYVCGAWGSQPEGQKKNLISVPGIMEYLGFDKSQEELLKGGKILSKNMTDREKTEKELAAASVMIIVRRPLDVVAEAFLSGDSFRVHDKIMNFHEISNQKQANELLDEFNGIRFSDQEKHEEKKLFKSGPGNMFNLSEEEIGLFKSVDEKELDSSGSIVKMLRDILYDRYQKYQAKGLSGVAPYARKKGRFVFPGEELKSSIDSMEIVKEHFPEFHRKVMEYPGANDDSGNSKFYWLKVDTNNRPNFVLTHQLSDISEEYAIIVEKVYYSLHTVDSSLIAIGCLPSDEGTVVFYMNHLFTDHVAGFAHAIKKSEGKARIAKSVSEYFGNLRDMLEGQRDD
jgi:hypothetical protein